MATNTRERILDRALEMFAENGYKGTNLRDLAQSLEISKSAIYRHFKSKEDIKDTLLNEVENYYQEGMKSSEIAKRIPKSYEEFYNTVMDMIDFTIHDKKIILTRKFLASQQFNDEKVKEVTTKHFLTGLEDQFTKVFKVMIKEGLLKNENPSMLAFCFVSPISSLILYCDREPEKEKEIIKKIKKFVGHFIKEYGVEK